jgi:hypothetical protein
MYPECRSVGSVNRRAFLRGSGAAVALAAAGAAQWPLSAQEGQAAPAQPLLPTVALGPHRITRLVAGYNPIGGFSHTTARESRHMREWFTVERTAEFLLHCENQGINTWQYDHTDKTVGALKIIREKGSKIQVICLHADRAGGPSLEEVMANKPLAIVHHGGVTDGMFRGGQADKVRDFVKRVRDVGALAGVSAHCPAHIKRIADEGWEVDLFMTCFYHVTRPREEMQKTLGKVPVGEPFFESDPDEMTEVVRQVKQPCLGFKILAAGRRCDSAGSVEESFRYAFSRIKPTDAVIVGMFPIFTDEVAENASYARKHGGA